MIEHLGVRLRLAIQSLEFALIPRSREADPRLSEPEAYVAEARDILKALLREATKP